MIRRKGAVTCWVRPGSKLGFCINRDWHNCTHRRRENSQGNRPGVFANIQGCLHSAPAIPMATPNNAPERKALRSWKEIATFLGVLVRSVQRWESDGLPVYRQGDGRKARVFAYPDELKQWLEAGGLREREPDSEAVAAPPESPPPRQPIPRKARW